MNWRFWHPESSTRTDTCAAVEPLLSLYSDGMASASEVRRVQNHLGSCLACRRALNWMQATRAVIAERPMVLPPPDMHARIARAIAASAPVATGPARRPLVLRPAFGAALVLLTLAGFGSYEYKSLTTSRPISPPVTLPPAAQARQDSGTGSQPSVKIGPASSEAKALPAPVRPHRRPVPSPPPARLAVKPKSPSLSTLPHPPAAKSFVVARVPNIVYFGRPALTAIVRHPAVPRKMIVKRAQPSAPALLAVKPHESGRLGTAPETGKNIQIARLPPVEDHVIEAPAPGETHPAPAVVVLGNSSSDFHPEHADALRGVRLSLANINGGVSHKVTLSRSGRMQTADDSGASDGSSLTHMYGVVYSSTDPSKP